MVMSLQSYICSIYYISKLWEEFFVDKIEPHIVTFMYVVVCNHSMLIYYLEYYANNT